MLVYYENQLREVVTTCLFRQNCCNLRNHEDHVRGVHTSLYYPSHFPLSNMLWSGDFVAKGEKGDCVALQEEGTSVYTRFTPSSGFEVAGSSLVVLWAAVLFLAIVAKV